MATQLTIIAQVVQIFILHVSLALPVNVIHALVATLTVLDVLKIVLVTHFRMVGTVEVRRYSELIIFQIF